MDWIPYELEKWDNQPLPAAKKYVLCQIAARPEKGLPVAIVVGYMRFAAGDIHSPMFHTPGAGNTDIIEAWCDCLPIDFKFTKNALEVNKYS